MILEELWCDYKDGEIGLYNDGTLSYTYGSLSGDGLKGLYEALKKYYEDE